MEVKRGNKKVYSRPELEVVSVDHEISMVMMTDLPFDPNASAIETTNNSELSRPVNVYQSSSDNNPFGDSSPNYNN